MTETIEEWAARKLIEQDQLKAEHEERRRRIGRAHDRRVLLVAALAALPLLIGLVAGWLGLP